jgi:hypothetical protein
LLVVADFFPKNFGLIILLAGIGKPFDNDQYFRRVQDTASDKAV